MLARLLTQLGMDCVTAGSAEEALGLFDERCALLVSDVVLPGRRGNELAAELMAKNTRCAC